MYSHDLVVMSLNPCWVELGVRSTSVQVALESQISSQYFPMDVHCMRTIHWSLGNGEKFPHWRNFIATQTLSMSSWFNSFISTFKVLVATTDALGHF